MNDYIPFKYQLDGVRWLASPQDNKFGFKRSALVGLIGDEPGLGKTAQALLAIRDGVLSGRRVLFVVPGSTAINWQKSWDRWILDLPDTGDFYDGGLSRVSSTKSLIPCRGSVVISHSMLNTPEMVQRLAGANFDGIVIDEIHKIGSINIPWGDKRKSTSGKRTTHLFALRNLTASKFEFCRIGLSGTPTRNYAREIYNIWHMLDPEHCRSFEDFARKYLSYDTKSLYNPKGFHDDFQYIYLRRTTDEVQKDLPEMRRTKLYTEITDPLVAAAYNKELDMLSNFLNNGKYVAQYDEETGEERPQSLLGYLIRLRHITGLAKAKEPAIIQAIEEYLDTPNDSGVQPKIVIGLHHQFVYQRLQTSLSMYKKFEMRGGQSLREREEQKEMFIVADGPAIMYLSIKAAGEGVDGLQHAARKAIIFERQWNGMDEEQFLRRIRRTGQKHTSIAEYAIGLGTIDEFFDEMVENKRRITNSVENADWETDGTAMRQLAEKIVMNPLKVRRAA